MGLQEQTIDVPLIALNQSWPATAFPAGVLDRINNAVAKKWRDTENGPILRVEKRDGFVPLPTVVRDPASGAVSTKTLANMTLLKSYRNQLLAVAGASILALSETNACWESPTYVCPTQALRSKVVYNNSSTVATTDSARLGSRTLYVWRDITGPAQATRAKIVDDDGTEIAAPFSVDIEATSHGKAFTDGVQFWVVTWGNNGVPTLKFFAYSTTGALLGSNVVSLGDASGYFDVTLDLSSTGIRAVQKNPGANTFVLYRAVWNGAAVVVTNTVVVGSAASTGRVAFLRNDTGDSNYYIGAIDNGGADWRVYQVTALGALIHTYTIALAQAITPFEITGYVRAAGPDIVVALSFLDTAPTPQFNFTQIYTVTFAGVSTPQATRKSLTLASRPFKLGSNYFVVGYYRGTPSALPLTNNIQQSSFFLFNLDFGSTFQVCGHWDFGTAYADWQTAAFFMHVSTPNVAADGGVHLSLAYRARSFTAQGPQLLNDPVNTIGIRDYQFGPDSGEAVEFNGELLIPGLQTTAWCGTTPNEHGMPLVPEQTTGPTVVGVAVGLSASATYEVVIVAEYTDNNGNRVLSPAGPPYAFSTGGPGNQQATYTVANLHVSNKANIRLSAYRTAFVNGIQSTLHYKVTNDLAPTFNDDGTASVTIVDVMTDAAAAVAEELYVDKGFLDRFPCPPFIRGCASGDRVFVIGYDGAVWFSGQKTEGDALWFTPAFRILLPSNELPTAVAILDNTLLIFGERESVYALPVSALPDNGGGGSIPTPLPLPLTHGCTGFAAVYSDGVMFSSTQGGLWTITRSLNDAFIGKPVKDETDASAVTGITVDKFQRVIATLSNDRILVYDTVVRCWYTWVFAGNPRLPTTHKGFFTHYATSSVEKVFRQTPGVFADDTTNPIVTDFRVNFHLGGVQNFKRIWATQFRGTYKGPHQLTVLAYIDDDLTTLIASYVFTPSNVLPYAYELPPKVEECASITLHFLDAATGVNDTASFEMVSFTLGVEAGLNRLPPSTRRIAPA